jgi:hypothetical protein
LYSTKEGYKVAVNGETPNREEWTKVSAASPQGIWRIRTNQKLRELYKDLYIVADIKKKRLEWLGHLVRMHHGKRVQKISESKLEGRRRMGRPRFRW